MVKNNISRNTTKGDWDISLISFKYSKDKHESLTRTFVFVLTTIVALFLAAYGIIYHNTTSTIAGVFIIALTIINSSKPLKLEDEAKIHHHIFNKARFFSSLFVVGVIVTSTAVLFNEPYTFLIGLMSTIVCILFFKVEQYKHETLIEKKTHKKRTMLALVLLIVGLVLTYIGLRWDLSLLFLVGIVLAIYDIMYLVGSHFKKIMEK